jgi:hypothetical protein
MRQETKRMNRAALAATKPVWLVIESEPEQAKLRHCVRFVESIIEAIAAERREPDTWEAMYISYALHAIVEHRYYGALTFAEMALIEPEAHRAPRLLPDGPKPVRLSSLQDAMRLVKKKLLAES